MGAIAAGNPPTRGSSSAQVAGEREHRDLSPTPEGVPGFNRPAASLVACRSMPTDDDADEHVNVSYQSCGGGATALTAVGDGMDDCSQSDGRRDHRGAEEGAYESQGLNSCNTSSTRSSGPQEQPGPRRGAADAHVPPNLPCNRPGTPKDWGPRGSNAQVAPSFSMDGAPWSPDRNPEGPEGRATTPLLSQRGAPPPKDWGPTGSPFAASAAAEANPTGHLSTKPAWPVWDESEGGLQILPLTASGRLQSGMQELMGELRYPLSSTASSLSLGYSTPSSQGYDVQHAAPWSSSGVSSLADLSVPSSLGGDIHFHPATTSSSSGVSSALSASGASSAPPSLEASSGPPSCQGVDIQHPIRWPTSGASSPAVQPAVAWIGSGASSPAVQHLPMGRRPSSAGSPMPRASSGRPPLPPRAVSSGSGTFLLQRWASGGVNSLSDGVLPPPPGVDGLSPAPSAALSASSKRENPGGGSTGAADVIGRGLNKQLELERPATAPAGFGESAVELGRGLGLMPAGSGGSSNTSLRSASEDPSFHDQHPFGVVPGTLEAAGEGSKGAGAPNQAPGKSQDLPSLGRGLSIRVPNSRFSAVEAMLHNRIEIRCAKSL
jgi:hypothetical protein